MFNNKGDWRVAVVVPAYRVKEHILQVLGAMPDIVTHIFVVDDACPEKSGEFVAKNISDARVSVVYLNENQGYTNKDAISDETRLLLGNYRYDNNSKNTLQFFNVQVRIKY